MKQCNKSTNLCKSNTVETFQIIESDRGHFVKSVHGAPPPVQHSPPRIIKEVVKAESKQPPKAATEKVRLKFGKIIVDIKNANNIKAHEEDGSIVIKLINEN
ncbi:MAG: hypothetical protein FWE16_03995 [Firmicutes bacterium]|nr:hypothetical protein [Bacillota bacterium]